jgi:hypothetical protein
MKRDPRHEQLGDVPQAYRPEAVTDPYGVSNAGGGYSNASVADMQNRVEQIRARDRDENASIGPARNVAVRARFAQSAFVSTDRSLQILNNNPRRMYFLIQNLGPNDIYVNFGNKAQINNVKIIVNGNYEPFVTPLDSIAVICDPGNTSTVTVIEGVEVRPGGY